MKKSQNKFGRHQRKANINIENRELRKVFWTYSINPVQNDLTENKKVIATSETKKAAAPKKVVAKKTEVTKEIAAPKKVEIKKEEQVAKQIRVEKPVEVVRVSKPVFSKKEQIVVRFKNVTKQFGELVANKDINFSVRKNEVHALLGENGAGKSTLMSILFGLYTPTSGSIEINGVETKIKDPKHANELKIAMLPQHFKLVENMTVLENVILGYEHLNKEQGSAFEVLSKMAAQFGINLNLKAKVEELPISDKQKVEILKIVWRNADIIIFDEPTSILTPQEIESFLEMVRYMREIGKTILIITHKLPEIKAIADRVTVIRKGEYIDTIDVEIATEDEMAQLMVGQAVDLNLSSIKREKVSSKHNNLEVKHLNYQAHGHESSLHDINFEIKEGEIVGIAAIDGNGQSELIKAISGLIKAKGTIVVDKHNVSGVSIKKHYFNYGSVAHMKIEHMQSYIDALANFDQELDNAIAEYKKAKAAKAGERELAYRKEQVELFERQVKHVKILRSKPTTLLSHIPEDRHAYGLFLDYSVAQNAIMQDIDSYTKFGFINYKDAGRRLDDFVSKYDIRGVVSHKIKARALSGGNQQKIILAREIERKPKVLLAAHPTRGLDVGAIRNVYESIINARNKGMSVLLSSGELDEIMQVSDRIIVMYHGKIVSVSERGKLTKSQLGILMAGGKL